MANHLHVISAPIPGHSWSAAQADLFPTFDDAMIARTRVSKATIVHERKLAAAFCRVGCKLANAGVTFAQAKMTRAS